jgi:hypothetical protein
MDIAVRVYEDGVFKDVAVLEIKKIIGCIFFVQNEVPTIVISENEEYISDTDDDNKEQTLMPIIDAKIRLDNVNLLVFCEAQDEITISGDEKILVAVLLEGILYVNEESKPLLIGRIGYFNGEVFVEKTVLMLSEVPTSA